VAAISVGSVEVDVVPNARGIRRRLQEQVVPAADSVGDEIGRVIGRHVSTQVAQAVRTGVTTGSRTAVPSATRGGEQTGSAFARGMRTRVEAALRSLPEVELTADSSAVDREIHQIRAQLATLRDVEIGVDIDAAEAMARITQLQSRLAALAASDADVDVRIDTGAAAAELAAVQAQVNRLDADDVTIDVDTRSATANLSMLTSAAIAFGPALLPVLPVAAAGLGAVAAAASAAAVGVGALVAVAVPAFVQMGKVLQAQKAAQDAATTATLKGGQAAAQAASRSLQMASAQQALASAHRQAAQQIRQAEQGVADAVRSAAEANRRAKEQLAGAVQQAADRQRRAAEQVRQAEEQLADAQRDAQRAQEDLTQARRDAAAELAELGDRVANARLSERDAALSVQEAEARLRATQAEGSKATLLERQRAQLAYDQAVQRLREAQAETQSLTAEKAAADKAGVEGSETVRTAQERLREAEEGVARQQRDLAKARADAARQQIESQEAVAEAQRNVARTQEEGARSVARAQEQLASAQQSAADSIASAQRQIEQASLSAAGGVDQAAIAQAKYEEELAKLTPSARETYDAFLGLRDAFSQWSRSLQPAVMPIFTRALNGLKNALPGLTPFVLEAAGAIQTLMDKASAELKRPFWADFRSDLQGSVKPAIEGLGVSFGNVFKGMAGVISAFLPKVDSVSARMQTLTGRFAAWGQGLKGSPEFERFLGYSAEMAPKIWEALQRISGALLSIGVAMSPISSVVLTVIGGIAQGVQWIADNAPWAVQAIYGIVVAMGAWRLATLLWTGVTWLATAAMAAFNLAMRLSPLGWIVLGITAVVTAIYLLWTKCDWFRSAVTVIWEAIKMALGAAWDWIKSNVLEPIGVFFTRILPGWAETLRDKVRVAWDVMKAALAIIWDWIKQHVLYPVRDFFIKTMPGWAATLRGRIIGVWDGIRSGISGAWDLIKKWTIYPIRDFFIKTMPGWAQTLRDRFIGAFDAARKGIKAAWDRIKGIAREPVQYVVDVVYNRGVRGVWNAVASAFGAPKLDVFKFASGGVMPGYTPGRDVHRFVSPTGGALELSGGEAIMRPEFTRAVGSGFVHTLNAVARSRGAQGVKAALAPMLGGNPSTPTDRSLRYSTGGIYPVQRFASGGIFDWIKSAGSAALGAGSAAWNKIKEGASWLTDTLEASARAGVNNVVDPLLKNFPGMDTGFGKMIRRIPSRIIDALFGYSKEADKRGAGGIGGPRIQKALAWARTQNGKPYQWGGNGNPSWDCSGFMSAIESVIRGQKPHRRWATGAFSGRTAPPGWKLRQKSPFMIGITNAGVGHTAGTLGGVNVESRGGDGVVVGRRARGYNDRLFDSWYGFKPGSYDSGGYLQPGFNLAYNGTGRPEPVFTTAQANALTSLAARGGPSGPAAFEGSLYLDSGEFLGRVRGEAQQVMQQGQRELISVITAS
jgi:hypothetical protein